MWEEKKPTNYEELLEKCNKLLSVGWLEDIDEFLPELMIAYDKLDLDATRMADAYDNRRDELFINMRKAKKEWRSEATDKDIETFSRHKAMEEFGDRNIYKTVVRHLEKYLNLLSSRQIKLMTDEKRQREMAI